MDVRLHMTRCEEACPAGHSYVGSDGAWRVSGKEKQGTRTGIYNSYFLILLRIPIINFAYTPSDSDSMIFSNALYRYLDSK